MAIHISPIHDRVVVRRSPIESTSEGGILLPGSSEKPSRGEVLAVGNGKVMKDGKVRPLTVKVGDHILFGKYSGTEVKIGGEELVIMREEDILGLITE